MHVHDMNDVISMALTQSGEDIADAERRGEFVRSFAETDQTLEDVWPRAR